MPVLRFIRTTFIGGVVVILPLVLLAAGVVTAVEWVRGALAPVAGWVPDSLRYPTLVAAGVLLLACFIAGLVFKTALGRAWRRVLERGLLEKIPGYSLFRTLSKRLGGESGREMAAAIIKLDDHELVGFVMERFPDGRCAVFVPSAPTPAVGSLLIVTGNRVRELDAPMTQVIGCFSKWGAGLGTLDRGTAM